jgi:hypothetical protein
MTKTSSKQRLANLIQSCEQSLKIARSLYDDDDLKQWAVEYSLRCQAQIKQVKQTLKQTFGVDYDDVGSKNEVIKVGSKVRVLADHMDGMEGSTATVTGYAEPAMLSDITMTDGMKMNAHKWLINKEVELI